MGQAAAREIRTAAAVTAVLQEMECIGSLNKIILKIFKE